MAISTQTEFENELVSNGDIANATNINAAPILLKADITALKDELDNVVLSGGGVSTFDALSDVTTSATEVNTLAGFTGNVSDFNKLVTYRTQIDYLSGLTGNIQTQINDILTSGGTISLATLGITATTDQINWLSVIANDFNRANVDGTEVSYLNGLSGNIQTQINSLNTAVSNLSGGGSAITWSSITDVTTSLTAINWVNTIYDNRITSTELSFINGLQVNVQEKFDELDSTIGQLEGSSGTSGVSSFNSRTGAVSLLSSDVTSALGFTPANTSSIPDISSIPWSSINEGTNSVSGNVNGTIELGGANGVSWSGGAYSTANTYRGLFGINCTTNSTGIAGVYIKGSGPALFAGSTGSGCAVFSSNSSSSSSAGVVGTSENGFGVQGEGGRYGLYTGGSAYVGGTSYPFTGSHYVFTDSTFEVGDIMVITDVVSLSVNNSIPYTAISSSAKAKAVYGVYNGKEDQDVNEFFDTHVDLSETNESSDSMFITTQMKAEWSDLRDAILNSYTIKGVNAIGEGMLNVCAENGNIEIGDYICTSSVPGKGMKQDEDYLANFTVAKSSQNVDWDAETVGENGCFEVNGVKCKMIACTYHCG